MYHILEEASNLSFETQSSYPDIPWTQIRGMRNRFAHECFNLNREVARSVIENDLEPLQTMTQSFLAACDAGDAHDGKRRSQ